MNEAFSNWLDDDQYVNDQPPLQADDHLYRLRGSLIECVDCTPADLRESNNNDNDDNDEDTGSESEDEDESDLSLNFGEAATFSTSEASYGAGRRTFEEDDFDHISVVGPFRVMVRAGSTYRVRAAGDDDNLRDVQVEREGNELIIRPRRDNFRGFKWRNSGNVLVTVELPELNKLDLVGAAQADVQGFSTGDLAVDQAGGAQLRLQGNFNQLDLDLAGGCRTTLKGKADELNVDGAGACEVAARDFTARRADIEMIGASKARLRISETLKAEAIGASIIEYSGKPGNVTKESIGGSRIRPVED